MRLRPRLSYANVAATLALVLAIGGGTVYAASELGKNSVKSKHIAKGQVKKSDLGKNSVTSPKVKNGGIKAQDIAAGVIPKIQADVTGSARGGPQGGVNVNTTTPLALTGTTTFTPRDGQVAALAAEAEFSVAVTSPGPGISCNPSVIVRIVGQQTGLFVSPDGDGDTATLERSLGSDADGPYGLIAPNQPVSFTAEVNGDPDCTANSRLERIEIRILQFK